MHLYWRIVAKLGNSVTQKVDLGTQSINVISQNISVIKLFTALKHSHTMANEESQPREMDREFRNFCQYLVVADTRFQVTVIRDGEREDRCHHRTHRPSGPVRAWPDDATSVFSSALEGLFGLIEMTSCSTVTQHQRRTSERMSQIVTYSRDCRAFTS